MYCGQLGAKIISYTSSYTPGNVSHLQVSAKPMSFSSKDFSLSLEYDVLVLLAGRGLENTSVTDIEELNKLRVAMMCFNQNTTLF